jgi:DNA-binding NarL/FixJ family response regulator
LLCTGFSQKMTEKKIQALGVRGLLMKPVLMMDLAQKIREVLDTSSSNKSRIRK